MKTHISLLLVLVLTTGLSFKSTGQGPVDPARPGSGIFGFGFGPGIPYFGGGGFGPAILLHYDQSIWKAGPGSVSLGGQIGTSFYLNDFAHHNINYAERWTNLGFVFRAAYHCGWKVRGLDTYAGFGAGTLFSFYHNTEYGSGYQDTKVGFLPTCFIGGSYFFNRTVGMNAEFGYTVAFASIGMDFRIGR